MKMFLIKLISLTALATSVTAVSLSNTIFAPNTNQDATANPNMTVRDTDMFCGAQLGISTGNAFTLKQGANWLCCQFGIPWYNFTVPAGGCHRFYCKDTSAIYMCNDNKYDFVASSSAIGYGAVDLLSRCCVASSMNIAGNDPTCGQQFYEDGTNIIVGYGNCNHPDNQRPADFPYPGPNGNCY